MEAFDLKHGLLLGAATGGVRSDGATEGNPWISWTARNRPRDGAEILKIQKLPVRKQMGSSNLCIGAARALARDENALLS